MLMMKNVPHGIRHGDLADGEEAMSTLYDPKIRVRLTEEARSKVRQHTRGKHGDYTDHTIGLTHIHIEKGILFAQVIWNIDGLDTPVSPEVLAYVDTYEIEWEEASGTLAEGIYRLCKGKTVLASGRVKRREAYNNTRKAEVLVSSKKREHAVQLFELIRTGKLRPAIEVEEFKQIEGGLAELRRLRAAVPRLEARIEEKNKTNAELQKRHRQVVEQLGGVQKLMAA